jgi:hypothetical protein
MMNGKRCIFSNRWKLFYLLLVIACFAGIQIVADESLPAIRVLAERKTNDLNALRSWNSEKYLWQQR